MRLSYYWLPLLETTNHLIRQPESTYESVMSTLEKEIEAATAGSLGNGFLHPDIQLAKFAAVACVDEIAISNDWPGATQWVKKPLQLIHFSTTRAGADFFEKASTCEEQHVTEVYALVLLSGYTGIYRSPDDPRLQEFRQELFDSLAEFYDIQPLATHNAMMFPEALPRPESKKASLLKHLRPNHAAIAAVIGIPLLVLMALYMYFSIHITNLAEHNIEAASPTLQIPPTH